MTKTLLVNWVYYKPVGHVVEALKLANGYTVANRDPEVHMMLNGDAPVEQPSRAVHGRPEAGREAPGGRGRSSPRARSPVRRFFSFDVALDAR